MKKENKGKDKKLKIAIVTDAVYPYNKGGKETRIFEISTRLVKAGYGVSIYCMKWWKGKEDRRVENGVELKAISKYYPLYVGKRRSIKQAIMFALSTFKLLREDFDVIDADHMPHLVLFPLKVVSILKRKKFFVTWNEVWGRKYWVEYMGISGNIAFVIEWLSARLADHIVAVSEHTKEKLVRDLGIRRNISVVNNGIDLGEIRKARVSKIKSDVIYAGRLLSHKNVDVLIEAVGKLRIKQPEIKCLIVGNGPEEFRLKQLTKKLGLERNIVFYDFLKKHSELYSLMKASKVFAFPSTREGFGIAALEANASGIPFVTMKHKDNATVKLINGVGNGFAISNRNSSWSQKLSMLIGNRGVESKRLMIDHASRYGWDNAVEKMKEVYRI